MSVATTTAAATTTPTTGQIYKVALASIIGSVIE
jgi:hypothetical protein